jgi:crotonobetainyl-CoA:carnitine CoA-transferase CaiB-like acyl-CoA transferase
MEKLQLNFESVKKINPQLIMVAITSFGQTGPYRDHKAYAINRSASGGFDITFGEPGRVPLTLPLCLGDYHIGAVGAAGALAALLPRERIQKGQLVDVAGLDTWIAFHTGLLVAAYVFYGRKKTRMGHRLPGPYPRTTLPCKDGFISMLALQGYQWKRFLEILGDGKIPEWYADDPRFKDRLEMGLRYADELDALLEPWLMSHTKDEIFEICRERRVPFAPVRNIEEVVNSSHLRERRYFVEILHPEVGKFEVPGPPYRLSKTPWNTDNPAPTLGQHNEKIYCRRLGYPKEKIVEFRRAGAI